jgi:hypothetical protein
MMDGETTAQHLERLITIIGEALAVADAGDQPLVGAHLHSCLRTAIALRAIPDSLSRPFNSNEPYILKAAANKIACQQNLLSTTSNPATER